MKATASTTATSAATAIVDAAQDEPGCALALPALGLGGELLGLLDRIGHVGGIPAALGSNRGAPEALYFTGNADADRLIAAEPLALLIGFVLDQQVTVPTAFSGPLKLQQRLGASTPRGSRDHPDRLADVFREKPAIHRFPGNMAKRVQELCARSSPRSTAATPDASGATRADTADLKRRLEALPGFGEMKVKALASVLARRFGPRWRSRWSRPRHARRRRLAGGSRRVPGREARLQGLAARRSRLIELRFYRDGGQSAVDVANQVAEFLAAADEPRARALRHPPPRRGGRDRQARSSAHRTAASPCGSSTTSTTPARFRCRRRPRPRPSCSRRCRSRPGRSRAFDLMHHKYASATATPLDRSMNWSQDSWTSGERDRDRRSRELAHAHTQLRRALGDG